MFTIEIDGNDDARKRTHVIQYIFDYLRNIQRKSDQKVQIRHEAAQCLQFYVNEIPFLSE